MLYPSRIRPALLFLCAGLLAGCAQSPRAPMSIAETGTLAAAPPAMPAPAAPETAETAEDPYVSLLSDAIARVSEHGLDPETYGLSKIGSLADDPEAQHAALREAWTLAATHLAHGYLEQGTLLPRRAPEATERNMFDRLDADGGAPALAAALSRIAPQHPPYLALRRELARQRAALAETTDPEQQAALAAKIDTLRINLERWRWLPHYLGKRSVLANIAAFDVTTYEAETPTSRHTAIFGQTQRQTPNFSDEIEYIIFNPWWEVPDSIARRDKIAQFRRDPGAVKRLGYQVLDRQGKVVDPSTIDWNAVSATSFPYRIRQAPGPQNALGQVKIMFPNRYNVYLHDTSEKDLFDNEQRAFSSGCIRVHDPLDLAAWILEETPGWSRAEIDTVVASGKETRVDLPATVPVYVVYLTSVSNSCGDVTYLPDVYERDAPILTALDKGLSD